MSDEVHPDLQQLAFLLGTWRGEGKGDYPTIDPFAYGEEITFRHIGKPFLIYAQRTWNPANGAAMHGESGYWRSVAPGKVEIVLAHPFGITEIEEGTIQDHVIEVHSTSLGRTSTAKDVTALTRRLEVEGDVLRYEIAMAAVGESLRRHLGAELRRQ